MKKVLLILVASGLCATAIVQGGGSQPRGGGTLPYKVYTAHLTQSGTDAPVEVIVFQNTIGPIVWSYSTPGNYIGTLSGAFPDGKVPTQSFTKNAGATSTVIGATIAGSNDGDTVGITVLRSGSSSNGFLDQTIEIRVYP